jgi:hypothetical protein
MNVAVIWFFLVVTGCVRTTKKKRKRVISPSTLGHRIQDAIMMMIDEVVDANENVRPVAHGKK